MQISNLFSTLVKDKALITLHSLSLPLLFAFRYLITRINAFQIALNNLFCNNSLSKRFCKAIGNKQMNFKQCLQQLCKTKGQTVSKLHWLNLKTFKYWRMYHKLSDSISTYSAASLKTGDFVSGLELHHRVAPEI